MADVRSIFVVGVGRSGTSLIQSMFAAHSQLAFPPETGFLRRYGVTGVISRLARRAPASEVVAQLDADPRLQRLGIALSGVVEDAAHGGQVNDLSVYRSMLLRYAASVGKPHVGDKDPRLIEHLDVLHAAFPDAHVVQIVRDPRDVLASKKKAGWSRAHRSVRHVFAYRVQLLNGRRQARKWFGASYHEVVYESLLARPEQELRTLCQQLGIDFESTMLQFSDAAKSLVAADEIGWKQETMGPLLQQNFGKWRNTLTRREVALVELACAKAMRLFGYSSSNALKSLTATGRVQVFAQYLAIVCAEPAYRLYRFTSNRLARSRS